MGSLSTSLLNAANSMSVYDRVFNVIENNITNANTPGYAKQDQALVAQPFDPSQGLSGGILAGPLVSSRSEYLEHAVRSQTELLGNAEQRATDLTQIEPLFDLTSTSGIAGALNNFFDSFSQLSVDPNSAVHRQAVINQAGALAQSINASAQGITQVSTNIAGQTSDVAGQINRIAAQVTQINQRIRSNSQAAQDAGLDAQMHAALENLSELTDYAVLRTSDGAYNVYIGGQTPLVLGGDQYKISVDTTSQQTRILDSQGNDITSQISRGRLGALIQEKNATIPGYLAELNTLAASLADTVNTQLFQGVDQNGSVPAVNLFNYNLASDAASTLAVANITPDQIAAAAAGAPGGNGNAIALARLATAPAINGFTFTEFYGNLGGRVGNGVAGAKQDQTQFQDQVTQAQAQRGAQSGVSLNQEATRLIQFQQAYQAAGKLVSVLDSLTQTAIDMVQR
jgi:flagellar hook-associated protein 1 FlgK